MTDRPADRGALLVHGPPIGRVGDSSLDLVRQQSGQVDRPVGCVTRRTAKLRRLDVGVYFDVNDTDEDAVSERVGRR